jgi:hypothetical protein
MAPLQIARGDIVEDGVAEDMVERLVLRNVAPATSDDQREFDLIVEFFGQAGVSWNGSAMGDDRGRRLGEELRILRQLDFRAARPVPCDKSCREAARKDIRGLTSSPDICPV